MLKKLGLFLLAIIILAILFGGYILGFYLWVSPFVNDASISAFSPIAGPLLIASFYIRFIIRVIMKVDAKQDLLVLLSLVALLITDLFIIRITSGSYDFSLVGLFVIFWVGFKLLSKFKKPMISSD